MGTSNLLCFLLWFLTLTPISQLLAEKSKTALIIIDVQTCFLQGGSLAVTDGDDVIPVINKIREDFGADFSMVVISQDWHCPTHVSFALSHPGKQVFQEITLQYKDNGTLCYGETINDTNFPTAQSCSQSDINVELSQMLWPVHCVQDVTTGPTSSNVSALLHTEDTDIIIKKGTACEIDSYSVFFDNGGLRSTGLEIILKSAGIERVIITGLALDYCVYYTSLDAQKLGFETYTVLDASKGVADDTTTKAKQDMMSKGITLIYSSDIEDVLLDMPSAGISTSETLTMFVPLVMSLLLLLR